jgi:hypothetical protein
MAKVVTPTGTKNVVSSVGGTSKPDDTQDDASSQSGTASYYTPKSLSGGYTGSAVDWAAAAKNDWERRRGYAVPGVDTQTSSTVPSPFKGTEQESVGTNDFMDAWKNSKLSAQHNLFDLLGSGDKDLLWEYVNDEALSPYYADIAGNWDAYSKWFDDSMATNVAPDFLNNVDSMAVLGNDSSVWNAYADYYNKNNYSLTDGSMLDQDSLDALRAGTAQGMLQTIFKNGGADSFYKLGLDSADFNDLLNSGVVYERAPAAQGLRDETGNQIDLYGINPAYSVGDMTPYRYRSSDPLSGMYDEYG